MVEVLVLGEPLFCNILLTRVKKSLINRRQVLQSAYRGDELMSWLKDWGVEISDAKREPSHLALRVNCISEVIVRVNLCEDGGVNIDLSCNQSFDENNFEVTVIVLVVAKISGGSSAIQGNISVSQMGRLDKVFSGKVQINWSKTWFHHPCIEINCSYNLFGHSLIVSVVPIDILFESLNKIFVSDRGVLVLEKPVL